MTRVAILNSRQSKTPVGNDPWVQATLVAVKHAATNGWTIVSSYGLNTWELVTWAAGQHGVPLILLCPDDASDPQRSDIVRRFELRSDLVEWVTVNRGEGSSKSKNWWEVRDAASLTSAEIILPISIRKSGRIEEYIRSFPPSKTDDRFKIPYSAASHHLRFAITPETVNTELRTWPDDWLIHWTRACHGPWPGESGSDFYSALTRSGDEYCRSGFRTLLRILKEGRIRSSSWRIGSGESVVACTELSPIESLALMRWRPRWSHWSIEPYGIAIHKRIAAAIGLETVHYVANDDWDLLSDAEKPFCHVRGKKADIWPAEREWRVVGNVDLSSIPVDQVRVITCCNAERDEVARMCDHRVMSFE